MALQEDEKLRVQQANDLVELIGEHVALKPQGREFAGLCPFHDDRRPSMQVSPAKQIFKCFACGAGGDVFSFMMNYHRLSFVEALHHLAQRAGIELSKQSDGENRGGRSSRERLSAANEHALSYYRKQLAAPQQGREARDYLQRRGVSDAMIEQFQLGYAPDQWDALAQHVHQQRREVEAFEQVGLVQPKRQGTGHIDRLRHRLIFPIADALGRPIAFGGRRLREEDEPKYLNSPEHALFNKSATLYGLHLAKKPIIDSKTAVIVEGYTDVIACHQAGFANVVATLGTALTREHVTHLRRYAEQVVLVFDPDEAGQKAADRAVEIFLTGEVDVAIAMLPAGADPADLLAQSDGDDRWRAVIERAIDALQYQFDRIAGQLAEATTVTGRQKVAEQYITRLGQLGLGKANPARRGFVVQHLSGLLHMPESQVNDLLSRAGVNRSRPGPANTSAADEAGGISDAGLDAPNEADEPEEASLSGRARGLRLAEQQLIGGLVRDNTLFHRSLPDGMALDEALVPDEMSTPAHQRLYQHVHDRLAAGESLTLAGLLSDLAEQEQAHLARVLTDADRAVEAAAGEQPERLEEVVTLAAQAIRDHQAARQYEQTKAAVFDARGESDPADDPAGARRLRELVAHNRDNPSPARIVRLGS